MISLTSPIKTRAHDWRAGMKLAALCVATMVLFALNSLPAQLAAFLLCLTLFFLPGRVFARAALRSFRPLIPFLAVLALWHGVTSTPVEGAIVALRMMTAVGFATLMTMTTRLTDLVAVVTWCLTPLRNVLPTRVIELAIALTIRFTPVLMIKGQLLTQAWRARSTNRPSWRILFPMTLLAIDDADHVAEALKARGGV
jgi:biotin transport system permease protein